MAVACLTITPHHGMLQPSRRIMYVASLNILPLALSRV